MIRLIMRFVYMAKVTLSLIRTTWLYVFRLYLGVLCNTGQQGPTYKFTCMLLSKTWTEKRWCPVTL